MTTRSKVSNAVKLALLATTAATLALSNPLIAAEQDNDEEENKVTVVGSRIKRTQVEGSSPVIVINQDIATEKGFTTVFDALKSLSVNTGTNQGTEFSGGFTPDLQTLNLRGFGVGNTLYLINGRRVANYPAPFNSDTTTVNLANIPFSAVEEIQILTTGASAIYGSDAVAGVINLILKKDVDATSFNLVIGAPEEALDKQRLRFQATTGFDWDSGNLVASYQYRKDDRLSGGDFEDYDSDLDYPYGNGILVRNNLNLNWWTSFSDPASRYVDPGQGACDALGNGTVYALREGAGNYCGRDGASDVSFRNAREIHNLFFYGNQQLGDNLELFADVLYGQSDSTSFRNSLFISEDIVDVNNIVATPFGFSFPDWYLAQRGFTGQELGRDLSTHFNDQSYSVSVGLIGAWGSHDWELSANYSTYELDIERPWFKAEEVVSTFLGDYQGTGFFGDNWWSGNGTFGIADNIYTPLDDTTRALVNNAIGTNRYGNETSTSSLQFVMNGDLFDLDAGAVSYALVAEYEKQDFQYNSDERIQQGPIAPYLRGSGWWNLTGYQGGGDRERTALGGELYIPLTETFNLELAGRFDNYDSDSSSIGTRFTPSAKFTWRPFGDDFLLRAGYSESYRAPDLAQVFTTTGFFTSGFDLVQCQEIYIASNGSAAGFDPDDCDAVSVFAQRVGPSDVGAEPLKDETGHNAWLGFSVELSEGQTLMATWNRTELEDLVQTESLQDILDDEFLCATEGCDAATQAYVDARLDRQVDPTTNISFITRFNASPENADKLVIEAIDVYYNYDLDTDYGQWNFDVDYSFMTKREFTPAGGQPIDLRDDPISGGWVPRSNLTASVGWAMDDWSARLTGLRTGSTTQRNGLDRVNPYIRYNFSLGYNWTHNFGSRLIINNVFNDKPPRDETHAFFQYPWYNIFVYPGAGLGRSYQLEFAYQLDN